MCRLKNYFTELCGDLMGIDVTSIQPPPMDAVIYPTYIRHENEYEKIFLKWQKSSVFCMKMVEFGDFINIFPLNSGKSLNISHAWIKYGTHNTAVLQTLQSTHFT